MPLIKIGIKGLAKFMTSGSAAQRKVVWDYKNPAPEGQAQAKYYRDAHKCIGVFHAKGHDVVWLESQAAALMAASQAAGSAPIAARLKNNARAVKHYANNFGTAKYDVLPEVSLTLTFGGVHVLVNPDLHVREGDKEKLLKFDFSEKEPEKDVIKIVTQGLFEAALAGGLNLPSSHILYVDVPRGIRHKAARLGARMRKNIEAACQNLAAIWPTV